MQSIEQLIKEILSLPSASRALLADKLVESLEFDTDSTIQTTWIAEAKRRNAMLKLPLAGRSPLQFLQDKPLHTAMHSPNQQQLASGNLLTNRLHLPLDDAG